MDTSIRSFCWELAHTCFTITATCTCFTVTATCATAGIASDRGDSREFRRQAISNQLPESGVTHGIPEQANFVRNLADEVVSVNPDHAEFFQQTHLGGKGTSEFAVADPEIEQVGELTNLAANRTRQLGVVEVKAVHLRKII